MLLLVIPAIWVVLACLGIAMCRLAARSDSSQVIGLDELLAAGYRVEKDRIVPDRLPTELRSDRRRGATG